MMFITVSGAYGRDYKSGKEMKADWDAGKDFVHETRNVFGGGTYINKSDAEALGTGVQVTGRFKRNQNTVTLQKG